MKPAYTEEQLTRIAQRIEEYRAAKQRQLLDRAIKLWRRTEADWIAGLVERPERKH